MYYMQLFWCFELGGGGGGGAYERWSHMEVRLYLQVA